MTSKLKPAVAYLRVSSLRQVTEGNSLETQRAMITAYANANGLSVVRHFVEKGVSASKAGQMRLDSRRVTLDVARPEWGQLLAELTAASIPNVLIAQDVDRLTRNGADLYILMGLVEAGVELHLVRDNKVITKQNIDLETLTLGVTGAMAAHESRQKARRTRDATKQAHDEGRHTGVAPLGLKWSYSGTRTRERGTLEIDEAKAPVIRKVFEKAASRKLGPSDLHRYAASLGLWPASRGRSRIKSLITHPIYMGGFRRVEVDERGRRRTIDVLEGNSPAIVSKQVWYRAQRVFAKDPKANRHARTAGARRHARGTTHPLSGVFHVSGCPLNRRSDRPSWRWVDQDGHHRNLPSKRIYDIIEVDVLGELELFPVSEEQFHALLKPPQNADEVGAIKRDLKRLENEAWKILRELTAGGVEFLPRERERLEEARKSALAEHAALSERLKAVEGEEADDDIDIDKILGYLNSLGEAWRAESEEPQRDILLEVLDFTGGRPIRLDADGNVLEVRYSSGWEALRAAVAAAQADYQRYEERVSLERLRGAREVDSWEPPWMRRDGDGVSPPACVARTWDRHARCRV